MKRCKLYHMEEVFGINSVKRASDICYDPLGGFDDILDDELKPFSDELSLRFFKETYDIELIGDMHCREKGRRRTFAVHNLSKDMKEGLMLLRNSQMGIYTRVENLSYLFLDDPIVNWICNFEDFDLLFAFVAGMDNGRYSFLDYIYPLTIDNFTFKGIIVPVVLNSCNSEENSELVYQTGEWFDLYRDMDGVYSSNNFFSLFDYDWKRDLPEIKEYIDREYMGYKILDNYEKSCTLGDILQCEASEMNDSPYNRKVVNHILCMPKREAMNRKIAILNVDYMNDGTICLKTDISFKYPAWMELIDEDEKLPDTVKYRFFLYLDVDEIIRSKDDFDETWFGGYKYRDYTELYNKDDALMEFSKQIPDILANMRIPIGRDD